MKMSDIEDFWGSAGAGCILLAKNTGRLCLSHRSSVVNEPNTWGMWGGRIDEDDISPKDALLRELLEESGYNGSISLIPLYVFRNKHRSFTYYNFLGIIEKEFSPNLNWENQGYKWFKYGDWPKPLHPGVKALLSDSTSITTIEKFVRMNADK